MDNKTEKKYIEIMRKKSGEERLRIAMELRKLALKMAEENIKTQNPKISSEELKGLLQKRIYGFSFPFGGPPPALKPGPKNNQQLKFLRKF